MAKDDCHTTNDKQFNVDALTARSFAQQRKRRHHLGFGQQLFHWRNGDCTGNAGCSGQEQGDAVSVIQWRVDPASGYADPAISGFDQTLIVVCNEGYSSSLAAASLQRLGFRKATDLVGGYRGWKAQGLPTCTVDEAHASTKAGPKLWRRSVIKGALYRLLLRFFQ